MLKSCVWHLTLYIHQATESAMAFNVSLCNTYGSEFKPLFVKSKISFHYSQCAESEHLILKSGNWMCADLRKSGGKGNAESFPSVVSYPKLPRISLRTGTVEASDSLFHLRYGTQLKRENELEIALELKCEFKFSDCSSLSEIIKTSSAFALPTSLHHQQFSCDLGNLYKTGKLSDITITVGSKTFSVHKSIVCARSAVFCRMFEIEMKESVGNRVDISDIDPDIMDEILMYMYSGWLKKPLEGDRAEELYAVADKYDIFTLKEKCSTFFKSGLSASNVCRVLQLADLHSDDDLYKQVMKFLSQEWYIFSTVEWQTFTLCNGSVAAKVQKDVKKVKL
ncbi:speckle-type POZ protein B-like [Stegodyphus dumicola]|uniref:speckle-type POZ protein B-like n=1 Tax=Stegodyphus dumicola TaxID=202533 RepID=UPI0015AA4500|nr:speckle-type POZ protein B-like [Stegodyphus dumicola]